MKFVIVLSVVAFALARDFDMKLEENGEKFTEQVKVDIAGKTEEIKVPKHGNRAAMDMLNDFNVVLNLNQSPFPTQSRLNMRNVAENAVKLAKRNRTWKITRGYSARKVMVEKACYISVLDKEQTPYQMKRSMEVSHVKFPTDSYWVESEKFVRLYEMTASEVGQKIAAHCAGYDMIFTMNFKKDTDILKIIKSKSAKMKRAASVNIRRFTSCNEGAKNTLETCPETKVDLQCKMSTLPTTCVYRIICKYNMPYGWKCDGEHKLNLPFCCDYSCRT